MPHPTIELSYGLNLTKDFGEETKRTKLGDGQSQRFRKGITRAPQQWRLSYADVTDTEAEALRTWFEEKGSLTAFTWTPTGQSIQLKFICLTFNSSPEGFNRNNVSVTIEQVFDQ